MTCCIGSDVVCGGNFRDLICFVTIVRTMLVRDLIPLVFTLTVSSKDILVSDDGDNVAALRGVLVRPGIDILSPLRPRT